MEKANKPSSPVATALKRVGPCLTSTLAAEISKTFGISNAAARQRISRDTEIKKLAHITFSRGMRFVYLQSDFGSPWYWNSLINCLLETNSAYGFALAAIKQRGGVVLKRYFPIISGAPSRQKKHLSPELILEKLLKAKLVDTINVSGVGECVRLANQFEESQFSAASLTAKLVAEEITLKAVKAWARKLGIVSFDRVEIRSDSENLPRVATCNWDLSAPSYLAPLLKYSSDTNPGFLACDICLDETIELSGIKPFLRKCELVRSLKNVGSCLQIFVAKNYSPEALELAKQKGIIPATIENLFGSDMIDCLKQLIDILTYKDLSNHDLNIVAHLFEKLGKIEGAAVNLRGSLFEFVAAEIARHCLNPDIRMNYPVKNSDGTKAEIDVISEARNREVVFIECKGYAPYSVVPQEEVEKWLNKRIPTVYRNCQDHHDWNKEQKIFEFWTTGKLSNESIKLLENAKNKVKPTKYVINYRQADEIKRMSKKSGDRSLFQTFTKYFCDHPILK